MYSVRAPIVKGRSGNVFSIYKVSFQPINRPYLVIAPEALRLSSRRMNGAL